MFKLVAKVARNGELLDVMETWSLRLRASTCLLRL